MTVVVQDADMTLHCGDVLAELAKLPDASVDCVVTSPPYWGLRDYGTGLWDGGNADCDHAMPELGGDGSSSGLNAKYQDDGRFADDSHSQRRRQQFRDVCGKCGAHRVDQQLGLEQTPAEYVERMVAVFREVRRVLAPHGTCWVNLGDTYNSRLDGSHGGWNGSSPEPQRVKNDGAAQKPKFAGKPKDLVGIPWAVAKALQEDYYTGRIRLERDRVWLAATIDGEGTICATAHTRKDDGRTRTMPQVCITNSSMAMLDEAQRIWPTSQSDHSRPGDGHLGTVPVYRWIVHGIENKTALVRELYPYLIVKKKQALLAYNMLVLMANAKRLGKSSQAQAVRDKREHLCRLISQLNHAQDVDVPSWCEPPEGMWERGWFLRSEIIWAKLCPTPCPSRSPTGQRRATSTCFC